MLPRAGARPPEFFARQLIELSPAFGLPLGSETVAGLAAYLSELDVWRRRTNLTGPFDSSELVSHALESVLAGELIPHGIRLVDIGSGAGFPGLPLAVARPDLSVTLLEPRKKRAEFLRHIVQTVPLPTAKVLEKRALSLEASAYDVATVRAVGDLRAALGGAPFLSPGGLLLAWTTDVSALSDSLGGFFTPVRAVPVPGSARRVIAVFRKG